MLENLHVKNFAIIDEIDVDFGPHLNILTGETGAGKTTTTAKIAGKLKTKGKKTLLAACDVYRPAAIDQLKINGEKQDVEVFAMGDKNKPVDIALATLDLTPKAASPMLAKLLKSAIANAENNHNMNKDNLYVAECFVTPGPTMKRIMPRAQGRAYRILKRTSHITIVLKEEE